MNTLSWLIYAGEILGRLSVLFGLSAAVAGAIIGFAVVFRSIECADGDAPEGSWTAPLRFVWIPFVLAIMAAALPSSTTVYMIAASEAGEAVVTSPDTIEIMSDLKAIIKKRLKEELGSE